MSKERITQKPTERHGKIAEDIVYRVAPNGTPELSALWLEIEIASILAEYFPDWIPIEELGDFNGGPEIEMTDGKSVDIAYWSEDEGRWIMRGSFVQLTHFREIGPLPQPHTSKEAE